MSVSLLQSVKSSPLGQEPTQAADEVSEQIPVRTSDQDSGWSTILVETKTVNPLLFLELS